MTKCRIRCRIVIRIWSKANRERSTGTHLVGGRHLYQLYPSPHPTESAERLAELTAVTGKLCDLERAQTETAGQQAVLEAAADELRQQLRSRDDQVAELESQVGQGAGTGCL